jgi:hypothetical protein
MLVKGVAVTAMATFALASVSIGSFAAEGQGMTPSTVDCAPSANSLPPALAGWTSKAVLLSATQSGEVNRATLTLGQAATVTLHQNLEIAYFVPPERPPGSATYGGLLAVTIGEAGTYQISLSSGAWIDLVRNGATTAPTAHAPGPACTGIRKTVQFSLPAGRSVIQLSGNASPTIQVMVSPVL